MTVFRGLRFNTDKFDGRRDAYFSLILFRGPVIRWMSRHNNNNCSCKAIQKLAMK